MLASAITRRVVLKSLAGATMLALRPASAGYWPTMDEVAHDPDIPVLGNVTDAILAPHQRFVPVEVAV